MPPILSIEWRSYDTNELTVTYAEHVGPIGDDACEACWTTPNYSPTCSIDITAAYRNLTRNLAAVVMAAAVAQGERERIGAELASADVNYEHRNEMYR